MRRAVTLTALSFLGLGACVESKDPPPLPDQATVSYGQRLYLSDPAQSDSAGWCNQLLPLPANIGTSTIPPAEAPGVGDGKGLIPYDCHVELSPLNGGMRQLRVDKVEVTNNLYQLCVDSDACEGPNPYDSDSSAVCQNSDRFDGCPVVDIGLRQAVSFCQWIGRRVPSSFEHIIMRQGGLPDTQIPESIPTYPTGNDEPATCDQAVLGAAGCSATKPRPVLGPNDTAVGGGSQDAVVANDGMIFDLIGNMTEWSSDRFPVNRGNAEGCPWFCVAALPGMANCTPMQTSTGTASVAPVCPAGQACVYGFYKPAEDLNFDRYPVCVTSPAGRFSGEIGATHGGAWSDAENISTVAGTYSRRTDPSPNEVAGNARGARTGFRCVGDRESGTIDGMGNPVIPEFDDRFELVIENP